MSLSRPVKFPLLKLPWLCIEPVVKSWDILDIIYFALISKRTRQIAKHLKISLNGIRIYLERWEHIMVFTSNRKWVFQNEINSYFEKEHRKLREYPLVFEKNAFPLYTSKAYDSLKSFTYGDGITTLRTVMEFLNEAFKCSVEYVKICGADFQESGDIGVKSTSNLCISHLKPPPFGDAQIQNFNSLLENLEVTDTCNFELTNTDKEFYVDPKVLKCKQLVFWSSSTSWITREIFLQFEVPQMKFVGCSPLSEESIVSFVTQWFQSDNRKFEHLHIPFQMRQVSLEMFQTEDLNPLPLSEMNRVPLSESFRDIDFSQGLEIVRHDGLRATIHFDWRSFLFYIWHDQPAITQN